MGVNIFHNDIQCSDRCHNLYDVSLEVDAAKQKSFNECMYLCMLPKGLSTRYIVMFSFFKNVMPSLVDNKIIAV